MTGFMLIDTATGFWGQTVILVAALTVVVVRTRDPQRKTVLVKSTLSFLALMLFRLAGSWWRLTVAFPRPCWDPAHPSLILCPESFSFPSGHALGAAMVAVFLSLVFRNRIVWVLSLAGIMLVSASRVFFGVHTPLDVIGGSLLGSLFGMIAWRIFWHE